MADKPAQSVLPTVSDSGLTVDTPAGSGITNPSPSIASTPDHPSVIGPYRIVGQLGEGGMGTVYRAEQEVPIKRSVAIKVVRAEYAHGQIIARFEAERQALARMDHPNISKVLDAGSDHGRPYFVMELAPGVPVTRFCDENKLSIEARLELFVQICHAIAHAHTKAILHRDIKASNVLAYFADGKPTVKVIDFGIAKAMTQDRLSDHLEVTQMGRPIGTYEAMSPEQVEGAADVDTRTDVYALGVLLYEMLCGHKPFADLMKKGIHEFAIQQVIRDVEPPRPSDRVSRKADDSMTPEISDARRTSPPELQRKLRNELEWIPLKAMRKDRNRRYASPLELAEDVENYLANRPLRAGPESRIYRLRKNLRRNRGSFITAAVLLLALAAGITTYVHNIRVEQRRTAKALAEAQHQEAEAKKQTAVAEAISTFQSDMLSAANPRHGSGAKVTVVQAIETSIKDLDAGKLKDQPRVEADVRRIVGKSLVEMDQAGEGEVQIRKSVDIYRGIADPDPKDLAYGLAALGDALRDQKKFDQAEAAFKESLALLDKSDTAEESTKATVNNSYAMVVQMKGDTAGALGMFKKILAEEQKEAPKYPGDILPFESQANTLDNLGFCQMQMGQFADAEKSFRDSVNICREHLPPNSGTLASNLGNLANALSDEGKLDEAESTIRKAVEIDQKLFPPEDPIVATDVAIEAEMLNRNGKVDEAEKLMVQSLASRRHSLPPGHLDIAASLTDLGNLEVQQRRFDEAEPHLKEALDIRRRGLPPGHLDIAWALMNLAGLEMEQHRFADAEPLLREALDIRRHALPRGHPDIGYTLWRLVNDLLFLGKAADAEPLAREMLDIQRHTLAPKDPQIFRSLNQLMGILDALGRSDESFALAREQLRLAQAASPVDESVLCSALNLLAGENFLNGRFADAEPLFRRAYEILQHQQSPDPETQSNVLSGRGRSLVSQGKTGEGIPMIRQALEIRLKLFGRENPATLLSAGALARALDQIGQHDQAKTIRREYSIPGPTPSTQPAKGK